MKAIQVGNGVNIISGKYAGLAGTVEAVNPVTGTVKVTISGVQAGQAIQAAPWLKKSALEAI